MTRSRLSSPDSRRLFLKLHTLLLLGFSSGLPLALSGATLQAWLTTAGVSLKTIGWLSLIGIPYTWKFLWAPLLDRFAIPLLGRRRGWILTLQLGLASLLLSLSFTDPLQHPLRMAALALSLAFLSASQDVVIDAYRADLLGSSERGPGVAASVLGYRLAMLISGALALVMAGSFSWGTTYQIMAGLMALSSLSTLGAAEPPVCAPPQSLQAAVIQPLREFRARPQIGALVLLILGYKLGDAFASALTSPFLLRGLDFTLTEVGLINKGAGLLATLLGATLGGILMRRWSLYQALWRLGIFQGAVTLFFYVLARVGHDWNLMVGAVFMENFGSGLGTTAFTALLVSLCHSRFSATQFALLSALSAVGRVYVGPAAGVMVTHWGWANYYLFAAAAGVPGILLVRWLRPALLGLDAINGETAP